MKVNVVEGKVNRRFKINVKITKMPIIAYSAKFETKFFSTTNTTRSFKVGKIK